MAAGSRAADADEQPRSGRRRATRGPRGVWWNRSRRAFMGSVRCHRADVADARRGRDAAGAERQTRRRVPDAPTRAPCADRQQQPGRALGELGRLSRSRATRPDDVWPDDRGVVDLHRIAGHHPGHIRDVWCGRARTFRRDARRTLRAHRGTGRHGRRAAAGRHHVWCRDPRDRGR